MSMWSEVLDARQLAAQYQLTAELDASFARKQREFYETRTQNELRALMNGAWFANDADGYQLARSYLALTP